MSPRVLDLCPECVGNGCDRCRNIGWRRIPTLELALPWPPSLNRIWRAVNSRILLSIEARAFHKRVNNALVGLPVAPITGWVSFTMDLHPPHKLDIRGYDAANREKITCDALTKQRIWLDDAQIDELHVYRRGHLPDHPNGLAVVTITEIPACS